MRIEKRLRDSFSEITPPTDNGTIVRNVIERAENMDRNNGSKKRGLNRTAVTIIAAAAVLAAATVSVGAATGWNFNSAFSQANQTVAESNGTHIIKAYSTEEAEQERNSESTQPVISGKQPEQFDYLSGGKELDLWYTFDDFKLNIKGVCADDYMAYVLFDIVFDEDFDYSAKAGWTAWEVCTLAEAVDNSLDEQPALGMVGQIGENIISQEGNILHCCVSPKMFSEYTWAGKTLVLDFKSVGRFVPGKSEKDDMQYQDKQELLFGEDGLHVEIPIDFPIFETTTWEINQPTDLAANEWNRLYYGGELPATVKYFSATPLSWRIYVEADTSDFSKGDAYCIDVGVRAGDKTLEIISGDGSNWIDDNGQGETREFSQPINPGDITAITVCGKTFELK